MSALAGKIALVTGAARGVGAAIADALARAGATVATADISDPVSTVEALMRNGYVASGHKLDVSDENSVVTVTADVAQRHGSLDILVNAAAVFHAAPLLEVTRQNWRDVLEVNVIGLAAMMNAAIPHMQRGNAGKIVNIASTGGRRGDPRAALYAASKAAVINLTQAAASEFAPHGICINAIAPGAVLTDMWSSIDRDFSERYLDQPEGAFTELVRRATPNARLAVPADIASVALFLCSPASDHMIGQTLNVDGGVLPA